MRAAYQLVDPRKGRLVATGILASALLAALGAVCVAETQPASKKKSQPTVRRESYCMEDKGALYANLRIPFVVPKGRVHPVNGTVELENGDEVACDADQARQARSVASAQLLEGAVARFRVQVNVFGPPYWKGLWGQFHYSRLESLVPGMEPRHAVTLFPYQSMGDSKFVGWAVGVGHRDAVWLYAHTVVNDQLIELRTVVAANSPEIAAGMSALQILAHSIGCGACAPPQTGAPQRR